MAEATINTKYRRRPWLAVVLSLVMAGLGHIYVGRLVRGLLLAFLCFIPLVVVHVALATGIDAKVVTAAAVVGTFVIPIVAIGDSYRIAKRTRPDYQLKDYNRWYVYVLLLLVETGGSIQTAFSTRANYIEAFKVPAASMYPGIVPGDRILADKTAYKKAAPKRGDVIVFLNPDDRRTNYIKRLVAGPGDTVEIRDNVVFVNDEQLERTKAPAGALDAIRIKLDGKTLEGDVFEETNAEARYRIILASGSDAESAADFARMTVPKNHCFVLGDNRNHSRDSRSFGPVAFGDIKGKVKYLYFPARDWSRFGKIDQ